MGLETATYIADFVSTNPVGTDDRSTADDHMRLIKFVLLSQFENFVGAAVTCTEAELNLLTGYVGSSIPDYEVVGNWNKQQYFGEATLTDATNISWDLEVAQVAKVTLGGNRTLDNPTNMIAGATYQLRIIQDGSGLRSLSFGSAYKFPGGSTPYNTLTANAVDIMCCTSDGTNMFCTYAGDFR